MPKKKIKNNHLKKSQIKGKKTADVYSESGRKSGKFVLPPSFGAKVNLPLIAHAYAFEQYNSRARGGHTKTRGERRGGGRKPWRQKGTGRARAGSIRSPIWRKGGVTFGPRRIKPKKKTLPQKQKKQAIISILSSKASSGEIIILSKIKVPQYSTKNTLDLLAKLDLNDSCLIIAPKKDDKLAKSIKNIPFVKINSADNLSLQDLLKCKFLLLTKDSAKAIQEIYG